MIRISEIFGPTIQGEGAQIGRPTVFVRTGGCDSRCSWCDTPYAVLPAYKHEWSPMSASDILDRVSDLTGGTPILVTLSGGNPALQPCGDLIDLGHERGFTFTLETQGTAARSWMNRLDHLCLSPKPPSSGMPPNMPALDACMLAAAPADVSLKVVVFDDADFEFARSVAARYPRVRMFLQVGNEVGVSDTAALLDSLRTLTQRVAQARWHDVTVLPQLHTLLWGNERGV
jgi:7-carboxy-7-deazaguanine synthase